VNVNPAYRAHELAFTLRKSRIKALFLWERDSRAEYAQILEKARHGQVLPGFADVVSPLMRQANATEHGLRIDGHL